MNINFSDYEKSLKIVEKTMPDLFPVVNGLVEVVKNSPDAQLDVNNRFFVSKHNGYTYKFNTVYNYLTIVKTAENPRQFGPFKMVIDDLTVSLANLNSVNKESKNMVLSYLDNENPDLADKYGNGITSSIRIWLEKTQGNYALTTENFLRNNTIKRSALNVTDSNRIFGE